MGLASPGSRASVFPLWRGELLAACHILKVVKSNHCYDKEKKWKKWAQVFKGWQPASAPVFAKDSRCKFFEFKAKGMKGKEIL